MTSKCMVMRKVSFEYFFAAVVKPVSVDGKEVSEQKQKDSSACVESSDRNVWKTAEVTSENIAQTSQLSSGFTNVQTNREPKLELSNTIDNAGQPLPEEAIVKKPAVETGIQTMSKIDKNPKQNKVFMKRNEDENNDTSLATTRKDKLHDEVSFHVIKRKILELEHRMIMLYTKTQCVKTNIY